MSNKDENKSKRKTKVQVMVEKKEYQARAYSKTEILYILSNDERTEELEEKELLFVLEYCGNGFVGWQAVAKLKFKINKRNKSEIQIKKEYAKISGKLLRKTTVKQAIKLYLTLCLGKYQNTLEYELIQLYRRQAFYNPAMFIKADGSPKFSDLKELGDWAVCVEGIETKITVVDGIMFEKTTVELTDRKKAQKQLANYIGKMQTNYKPFNYDDEDETQKTGVLLIPERPKTTEEWAGNKIKVIEGEVEDV